MPDKWLIVKVDEYFKVFAVWSGGYLHGDSWRCSSIIEEVIEEDGHFLFHCKSGSTYRCNKECYGTNSFGSSILSKASDYACSSLEVIEDPDEAITSIKKLKLL